MTTPHPSPTELRTQALVHRHMRFGWWSMLLFVTLGIALEALHAVKSQAYLGVGNETRRLMWTLAHAHGLGLSLLHLGFGASVRGLSLPATEKGVALLSRASLLLAWGSVLVPLGFFAGGIATYGGDPGLGALLVPPGALAVWAGVLLTAWTVHKRL